MSAGAEAVDLLPRSNLSRKEIRTLTSTVPGGHDNVSLRASWPIRGAVRLGVEQVWEVQVLVSLC